MRKALLLVVFCLVSAVAFTAGKTLDMWVIDTDGGLR